MRYCVHRVMWMIAILSKVGVKLIDGVTVEALTMIIVGPICDRYLSSIALAVNWQQHYVYWTRSHWA